MWEGVKKIRLKCQNVLYSKFLLNTGHSFFLEKNRLLVTFLFFYRFVAPLTVASPHGWLATLMRVCKISSQDPPAWESAANSLSGKTGRTSPWVSSNFILHYKHKYVKPRVHCIYSMLLCPIRIPFFSIAIF